MFKDYSGTFFCFIFHLQSTLIIFLIRSFFYHFQTREFLAINDKRQLPAVFFHIGNGSSSRTPTANEFHILHSGNLALFTFVINIVKGVFTDIAKYFTGFTTVSPFHHFQHQNTMQWAIPEKKSKQGWGWGGGRSVEDILFFSPPPLP